MTSPRPAQDAPGGTVSAQDTGRIAYVPALDGLRAVAVLLVLVHHVLQPRRFGGFVGVDVFFVLSGYLITTILTAELRRTGRLRFGRFYLRRLLRLYPALLVLLVVTTALRPLIGTGDLFVYAKRDVIAATYTGNLYMDGTGNWMGPLTHTWSLAMEEQYYLVWPVVVLLGLRAGRRSRWLLGIVVALTVVSSALSVRDFDFGSISHPPQSAAGGLLLGSALAIALADGPRRWARHPAVGLGGVALLALGLVLFGLHAPLADGAYVVIADVATALIVAQAVTARTPGPVVTALSVAPAVWLGRISYGVYLWHYPAVLLVARQFPHWSALPRLVVVAGASIGIAWASFRFVESPFLRLKDRMPSSDRRPSDTIGR